jgi:peptide/nickel transport system permease protein
VVDTSFASAPSATSPAPTLPLKPWLGVVLVPLGIAAVFVALGVMTDRHAAVRLVVSLAGLALAYLGVDRVAKRIWGPSFETDLWLAIVWVGVVVLVAVMADALPLAEARDPARSLTEPSRARPDLFSRHPFGTDTQGFDILGGVIYGARVSLQVSLLAVTVGTVVGGLVGVAAGFFGGRLDGAVGILTDTLLAFPPLILLLAVVTAFEPGVLTIALALALLTIPTYVRLARANTLAYAHREFVLAAKALGAKPWRIISRELIPNVVRPLMSFSFIIIAVLIVAEASLSFLGVGIQRPTPTWGNMISAGESELQTTPHMVFIPGVVMFATVFALNRVGDKARALWDPKQGGL